MDLPVQLVKIHSATWHPTHTSLLSRWHLLSLDAPCVAVAWTCLFARAAHTPLSPAIPAAMFLAVWIIYAADRLLDGLHPSASFEPRHRFHLRHRRAFTIAIAAAAIALIPLTLEIPRPTFQLYLALAALLFVWFAIVHATSHRKLPKELLPGIFCAAAAIIPIGLHHRGIAIAAIAYCVLVTLNCCCISTWEHDTIAAAHPAIRFIVRRLQKLLLTLALVSVAASLRSHPILLAIALSSILLLILDRLRHHFDPTDLRAAADLVLLTPLVFLLPTLR